MASTTSITQDEIIASIPSYLRQFVVKQDYSSYTPQDHAVWRYIMHRNISFLKDKAHEKYLEGLEKTGITAERIPDINEMNACLGKIGWRAVVVDGFVPPAAFMEFQALKILVISAEIRNINNILYTPAPDIVHEAAGHAPIIADSVYSEYLQLFGRYGMKSVFSSIDYDIYEAIRNLSIIKEYPDTTDEELKKAQKDLEAKMKANTEPSESNLLSRMHWWTVEYGLVGKPDDFKIFGAGLLSSVGESKHCMSDEVKKISLSVDCVNYDYDITEMQPQLFVAKDFGHLKDVLEEFADDMCFRKGGLESLKTVKASENVGTYEYSSGLQVSGTIGRIIEQDGEAVYISTEGQTQLSFNDNQISGHGTEYHSDGFSSPAGNLKDIEKPLEHFSDSDLIEQQILTGDKAELEFESGVQVKGIVEKILEENDNIVLISFTDCHVTYKDETLFEPEWGFYDMAVGKTIVSAYSGSADKEHFNVYPPKSEKKAIKVTYTEEQRKLFAHYTKVHEMRSNGVFSVEGLQNISEILDKSYEKEWLLRWEIYELMIQNGHQTQALTQKLRSQLNGLKSHNETYQNVITAGMEMMNEFADADN